MTPRYCSDCEGARGEPSCDGCGPEHTDLPFATRCCPDIVRGVIAICAACAACRAAGTSMRSPHCIGDGARLPSWGVDDDGALSWLAIIPGPAVPS